MKHPIFETSIRILFWLLAWIVLALGQSLLFHFAYGGYSYLGIIDSIVSLLIYSGIALSMWYPFSFFNSGTTKISVLLANLFVSGAIYVTLWILITRFVMTNVVPDQNVYDAFWDSTLSYRIGSGVFIYFMIVMSYYLYISLINLSEKNAKEAQLKSLIKETELKMLRSQINPHFLFNSLNSISSLTITDPEKARDMVVKLSEFMRYSLSRKDEQPVSLRSELENLRLYLEIEKVRFGNKLITEENIEENCLNCKIPVMLLQPLYENAVKHGVYESTECVRIISNIKLNNGYLDVMISNNFEDGYSSAKGTGTGLINVKRRLELFYGKNSSMETIKTDSLYTVKLIIPVEKQ